MRTALTCGRDACPEHGVLCAFHGDEADRCSTCHETWFSIEADDYHSCEHRPSEVNAGFRARAARARQDAAQSDSEPIQSTFCPHVEVRATGLSEGAGQVVARELVAC